MIIICRTDEHGRKGHFQPAREISFEWRFAGEPIVARFIIFIRKAKTSLRICEDLK